MVYELNSRQSSITGTMVVFLKIPLAFIAGYFRGQWPPHLSIGAIRHSRNPGIEAQILGTASELPAPLFPGRQLLSPQLAAPRQLPQLEAKWAFVTKGFRSQAVCQAKQGTSHREI